MANSGYEAKALKTFEAMAQKVGAVILSIERRVEQSNESGLYLVGFSVRLPNEERPDVLLTARARTDTAALVAFHGAPEVGQALVGFMERFGNGSLKWKEDQYG